MSSRLTIAALVLGLLCLCAAAAFAQTAERVPHIDAAGQGSYQSYLKAKAGKAFAISEGGGHGWGAGWSKIEGAIGSAMDKCIKMNKGPCKVYALNDQVVWRLSQDEAIKRVSGGNASGTAAPGQVPYLKADGQRDFERVKNSAFHRAFFISEGGGYGAGTNASTRESALRIGKQNCEKRDPNGTCKLYLLDGYVVWGKDPESFPRYADAPRLGSFVPSDYTPVLGPQKAKGVIIWSHGNKRGVDNTGNQPHGYVSRFLTAGWDVYRFNREWSQTRTDIPVMIESIAAAKAAGYAKVVLAGQSQGGWFSLAAVAGGAMADGVISIAPGNHGSPPSSGARQEFRQLLRDIRSRNAPDIPILIALFENDSYDPGGRFADVPDVLGGSAVPFKLIDRPKPFKGHGAGDEGRFNDVFGRCIFSFATAAATATEDCK